MQRLFDSPVHLLILVLVIVVVFGWKRLPDASRSLGRSLRIFKSEVEDLKGDGKSAPRSAASSDTVKGDVVPPADAPAEPSAAPPPPADGEPAPTSATSPAAPTTPQQHPGA